MSQKIIIPPTIGKARWARPKVQARLVELGMTQSDLAETVGITPGTISRSVTGARDPSLAETYAVSRVLGIPIDAMIEIVTDGETRPKSQAGPPPYPRRLATRRR